jgi:hypothetical protein
MLVVAIPVLQVERLLTLDHLSADKAPPVLRSQDLRTTPRSRLPCQLPVAGLKVRLPGRVNGVGVPFHRDVALRFDHLSDADELLPGVWSSEPPGFPRLVGTVALGSPGPGCVRVALRRPPLERFALDYEVFTD